MIFLGIGSNLSSSYGDRFYNINSAISYLNDYGIQIVKKSSFYETPSYPDKKKPKFINIVIKIKTLLGPVELLTLIISIEKKIERKRTLKNDPRTCDIDIIDFNGLVEIHSFNKEKFEIPHKELSKRNFVLFPLYEIEPKWKHPKTKVTVKELINKLSSDIKKSILIIKKN